MNRSSLIRVNILASFLMKGWGAVIVFLMVPLTLKMLGEYSNGVWLTISSMMMWIDMFDIGLGSGLRNAVAEYMAKDQVEKARSAISSTLFMLFLIVIPVIAIVGAIIYCGGIYDFLGIDSAQVSNLQTILFVATVLVSSSFVFKTIGNVYMGLQLPAVSNLLMVAGQTLSLVFTFVAYVYGSHSLLLVVIINTMAPLLVWIAAYPYTFLVRYKELCPTFRSVDMSMAKSMCTMGVKFFIIQICSVVLFMSTNIIISRIFSPSQVTTYQIAYRYYSIILVFFTIVCMPFWNATTDAYTKGDMEWIQKASRKMNVIMLGIMMALVGMTIASPFVYKVWVGSGVEIPFKLSVAMAIYIFVIVLSQRYSYFLNGIGALRIQIIFTVSATVVFLPLANIVCDYFPSVVALVLVMCVVNVPGLLANIWKFNMLVSKRNQS